MLFKILDLTYYFCHRERSRTIVLSLVIAIPKRVEKSNSKILYAPCLEKAPCNDKTDR